MDTSSYNHQELDKSPDLLVHKERISYLKNEIKVLKQICDDLDPFGDVSIEHKQILKRFGILDFSDPYRLTNQLIFVTENAIEELQKLEKDNA